MKFWADVKSWLITNFSLDPQATDAEVHQAVLESKQETITTEPTPPVTPTAATIPPVITVAEEKPTVPEVVVETVSKASFDALQNQFNEMKTQLKTLAGKPVASVAATPVGTPSAKKAEDAPMYLQNPKNAHLLEKWMAE
jgi:hypothetical protein